MRMAWILGRQTKGGGARGGAGGWEAACLTDGRPADGNCDFDDDIDAKHAMALSGDELILLSMNESCQPAAEGRQAG